MSRHSLTCFLIVVVLVLPHVLLGQDSEGSKTNESEFDVDYIQTGASDFIRKIDLGSVAVGDGNRVLVHFYNRGDDPIQFASVRVSCSCMTAKIPKEKIPPGESVQCEFAFRGELAPRQTHSQLVVDASLTDATHVQMQFSRFYSNLATFSTPEYIHSFTAKEADLSQEGFKLPLVTSQGMDLTNAEVIVSPELRFADWTVGKDEKSYFLQSKFIASQMKERQVRGEVYLRTPHSPHEQECLVTIRRVESIEIIPQTAIFTPSDEDTETSASTLMLRLRDPLTAPKVKVSARIADIGMPGDHIDVESRLETLAAQIYRVRLVAPKFDLGTAPVKRELVLEITVDERSQIFKLPFVIR